MISLRVEYVIRFIFLCKYLMHSWWRNLIVINTHILDKYCDQAQVCVVCFIFCIEQCFSKLPVHTSHPAILSEGRFWGSRFGGRPRGCISNKCPGACGTVGWLATLWEVFVAQVPNLGFTLKLPGKKPHRKTLMLGSQPQKFLFYGSGLQLCHKDFLFLFFWHSLGFIYLAYIPVHL